MQCKWLTGWHGRWAWLLWSRKCRQMRLLLGLACNTVAKLVLLAAHQVRWSMLCCKLAELIYALLCFLKAEIWGIFWRFADYWLCLVLLVLLLMLLRWVWFKLEDTSPGPDVANRKCWRICVLRLRWILVVELLSVKSKLSRLALVGETCEMRKLRNWTCWWNARSNWWRALLLLFSVIWLHKIVRSGEKVCWLLHLGVGSPVLHLDCQRVRCW